MLWCTCSAQDISANALFANTRTLMNCIWLIVDRSMHIRFPTVNKIIATSDTPDHTAPKLLNRSKIEYLFPNVGRLFNYPGTVEP